ncbi:hypothetical protein LCGC14_1730920 [marine sediment metagenome]|uniref:Uncharacterized protein n=1 Tax=marine sediment metagenome TaxID=412755 RepID=A0A0F9H9G4_9ZZZZ
MAKNERKNGTALAKIGGQEFAIMMAGAEALPEILRENVGAEGLGSFDLDRVKIPSGGMQAWTIPGIEKDEIVESFTGVIIYHKLGRVYWAQGLEEGGGNSPPDCISDDCVTGIGEPGGKCSVCPFAQFGSNGKGQACKQIKMLFVMRENALLPLCVSLPPTSLRGAKQYMLRLASNALPYYSVLTRFGLEKVNNASGIEYSKAVLSVAEKLTAEQAEQFKKISLQLRPHFDAVKVEEVSVD